MRFKIDIIELESIVFCAFLRLLTELILEVKLNWSSTDRAHELVANVEEISRFNQLRYTFHAEVDSEAASLVDTFWMSSCKAVVGLGNLLDDGEAKAETFAIHLCRAL